MPNSLSRFVLRLVAWMAYVGVVGVTTGAGVAIVVKTFHMETWALSTCVVGVLSFLVIEWRDVERHRRVGVPPKRGEPRTLQHTRAADFNARPRMTRDEAKATVRQALNAAIRNAGDDNLAAVVARDVREHGGVAAVIESLTGGAKGEAAPKADHATAVGEAAQRLLDIADRAPNGIYDLNGRQLDCDDLRTVVSAATEVRHV